MDKKAFKFSVRDMTPLILEEESGSSEVTPVGDSDLSIANVTFKWKNIGSSGGGTYYVAGPFIGTWGDSDATVGVIGLEAAETTAQIVLYKGRAGIEFYDNITVDTAETTGDIDGENRVFIITGDATIAFESFIESPPYSPDAN